uniref:RING-type domain-containing protein n=1 Tax=Prolemur simus TaxID=1328070 RepID=A0A8C8YT38_PROSS
MGNCLRCTTLDGDILGYGLWAAQNLEHSPPHQEYAAVPTYLPTPSQPQLATQLIEEEQTRLAQRISLIQHLSEEVYDPGRDGSEEEGPECGICFLEFACGDPIRRLPCQHFYHLGCIDEWLTKSFTCPYCRGPAGAEATSALRPAE